jgi:hypothetical protein
MLTMVLGYFLIGVFIFWLAAAVFGADHDVPVKWQLAAIALWPLAFALVGLRMAMHRPINEAATEEALHRHESRTNLRRTTPARRGCFDRPTARRARS